MYAIISHNAVGTYYNAVLGFETLEEARAFRDRWFHTGIGDVIILESDLETYRKINDRWNDDARQLQK